MQDAFCARELAPLLGKTRQSIEEWAGRHGWRYRETPGRGRGGRVAFRNLGYEDAAEAMREICEVAVSEGALRSILGKRDGGLPVYMLYRWAQLCEAMAKKYGVDEVREEHLLKKGAKL